MLQSSVFYGKNFAWKFSRRLLIAARASFPEFVRGDKNFHGKKKNSVMVWRYKFLGKNSLNNGFSKTKTTNRFCRITTQKPKIWYAIAKRRKCVEKVTNYSTQVKDRQNASRTYALSSFIESFFYGITFKNIKSVKKIWRKKI